MQRQRNTSWTLMMIVNFSTYLNVSSWHIVTRLEGHMLVSKYYLRYLNKLINQVAVLLSESEMLH